MIGMTLPLASNTRFSFGCIAWTCRSMNWKPRMHSAARPSTTIKRAWTFIVHSCTVNVMLPFWRSLRPPAPTIWNSGGPGMR
jgi:hypothetical protein